MEKFEDFKAQSKISDNEIDHYKKMSTNKVMAHVRSHKVKKQKSRI
jgi:hypothetical protein